MDSMVVASKNECGGMVIVGPSIWPVDDLAVEIDGVHLAVFDHQEMIAEAAIDAGGLNRLLIEGTDPQLAASRSVLRESYPKESLFLLFGALFLVLLNELFLNIARNCRVASRIPS